MNVLVDASVWIDHLRRSDSGLVGLLQSSEVVMHSAVLGELACGTLPNRRELLSLWSALSPAAKVSSAEALRPIGDRRPWGKALDGPTSCLSLRPSCRLLDSGGEIVRCCGQLKSCELLL